MTRARLNWIEFRATAFGGPRGRRASDERLVGRAPRTTGRGHDEGEDEDHPDLHPREATRAARRKAVESWMACDASRIRRPVDPVGEDPPKRRRRGRGLPRGKAQRPQVEGRPGRVKISSLATVCIQVPTLEVKRRPRAPIVTVRERLGKPSQPPAHAPEVSHGVSRGAFHRFRALRASRAGGCSGVPPGGSPGWRTHVSERDSGDFPHKKTVS